MSYLILTNLRGVAGLCRLSNTYNFVDNTHTIQTQTSGPPSSGLHVTLLVIYLQKLGFLCDFKEAEILFIVQ
jgi:hypothetical protein